MQFAIGWFAHAIYSPWGNYPEIMINTINKNSKDEGLSESRLPEFSRDWKNLIVNSADFLGLNYYTSRLVELRKEPEGSTPSWKRDTGVQENLKPEWKKANNNWLYSAPEGLGDILRWAEWGSWINLHPLNCFTHRWIKKEYNNVEVIITENGWSDSGQMVDTERIEYHKAHLNQVLSAVAQDNCNVTAYTVWTIIDNFEWISGYT